MFVRIAALFLAIALMATACSGTDDADEVASDPADEAAETADPSDATETAEATPTATPTTEPETEGESTAAPAGGNDLDAALRVAYNTGPESLDPLEQTSGPISLALQLFYDRLVHAEPDGTLVPGLATEWEYVDDTTFEMTLREGVVFHDGTALDAEAVKVNLDRTLAAEDLTTIATAGLAMVDSVEVVDDLTVRLLLSEPTLDMPLNLSDTAGMMISPAAIEAGGLDLSATGAGMFTLDSFSPGAEVSGTRFDDYWDPDAAQVAEITYLQIADADARLNALRSGQIDMTFVEPRQVQDAEAAGLELLLADSLSVFDLITNTTLPPLDDEDVRLAISQAIDREVIVEQLFFGYGEATLQLFPSDYYASSPDHGLDFLPYDPAAAAQRLEDAGLSDVSFEVLILNRPQDLQMAEVLQGMLAEAGITMELVVREPSQFSEVFTPGLVPVFLGRWGGRSDPLQTLTALMGPDGSLNPGGGTTETMASLLEEIRVLPPGDERTGLLQQASAEQVETMLEIPLVSVQVPWMLNGCVTGFDPYLNIRDEFRGVGIAADCEPA